MPRCRQIFKAFPNFSTYTLAQAADGLITPIRDGAIQYYAVNAGSEIHTMPSILEASQDKALNRLFNRTYVPAKEEKKQQRYRRLVHYNAAIARIGMCLVLFCAKIAIIINIG